MPFWSKASSFSLIYSILTEDERKKQILQIELLYTENSYILDILQRFKKVILLDQSYKSKSDCLSSAQLFFSFVVLLSQNETVFKKYSCYIIEIVNMQLRWTLFENPSLSSYMIDICTLLFNVKLNVLLFI